MRRRNLALVAVLLIAPACVTGKAAEPASSGVRRPPAPSATTSSPESGHPVFTSGPLEGEALVETQDRNWHPGCPVPLSDLRLLTVSYHSFDGSVKTGPLVVNASVADDVLWVFRRLFRADFPIKHIALPRKWHAQPRPGDRSTVRSVTAAFNCRPVTNGTTLSQHSYGWAIDINPLQNPYIGTDGKVLRRAAKPYVDRSKELPGMIHPEDIVVRSFTKIGWGWGGDWITIKDYMHFSLTGR